MIVKSEVNRTLQDLKGASDIPNKAKMSINPGNFKPEGITFFHFIMRELKDKRQEK